MKSEHEICFGFQRGERWAFEAVAKEHFTYLLNFITNLIRNRDRAMELTQEAFFLACRAHKQVNPEKPIAPWLFQIARNLAYKEFHRRKKHAVVLADADSEEVYMNYPDTQQSPAQESFNKEIRERIQRALQRLKPKHRDILILRMVQGLPSERVSQMMDLPVATVNTRTHRALKQLQRYAQLEGIREEEVFSL